MNTREPFYFDGGYVRLTTTGAVVTTIAKMTGTALAWLSLMAFLGLGAVAIAAYFAGFDFGVI